MAVTQRLLKLDYFKETFSFDDFFESLVGGISPFSATEANGDSLLEDGVDGAVVSTLQFPEAPKFQPLFKETRKALGDLCFQVDARLDKLRKDVVMYEKEQKQTFEQLQDGVEALTESFDRLDSRVASVGHTAAKIGDHLQSSDSQKTTAKETIDLVRYMMYFNESPTYVGEEPPLFSDDDRVSEATAVAQKLRAIAEDCILTGAAGEQRRASVYANGHLDVAAKNLQAFCNELENRLLGQFDAASQKGDLWTMGDRAQILSQFNKGSSVMQRYVASRPMFMDVEVMNKDTRTVLGVEGGILHVDNVLRGLMSVYKEIAESVQAEAKTVAAVFPSPASVMSILVQLLPNPSSSHTERIMQSSS
ncbi:hypothetical protein M758_12G040800 [Ceratodon purpureus]|nr:hypothetical protein M758_12G040800 [Ceratodon purpureus]